MFVLGLTGNIACGKSTVAKMLAARGAVVLDSDLLVRELYADAEFASQVAALFEAPITKSSGEIDRDALGKLVFGNPVALRQLEKLVHPAVLQLRQRKLAKLSESGTVQVAVIEAVKLLEAGQAKECAEIWCVVCAPNIQVQRLMTTRGLSRAEAEARLASQPSREQKEALAGDTPLIWIENNASLVELEDLVAQHWVRLRQTIPSKENGNFPPPISA